MKKIIFSLIFAFCTTLSLHSMQFLSKFSSTKSISTFVGSTIAAALKLHYAKPVKAETFFYKEDGSPLTEQEHEAVYDIKLRNQFPMSLAHGQFQEDEMAAMQKELNEKVPGTKVSFIPTTLYELFFIHSLDGTLKKTSNTSPFFEFTEHNYPENFNTV